MKTNYFMSFYSWYYFLLIDLSLSLNNRRLRVSYSIWISKVIYTVFFFFSQTILPTNFCFSSAHPIIARISLQNVSLFQLHYTTFITNDIFYCSHWSIKQLKLDNFVFALFFSFSLFLLFFSLDEHVTLLPCINFWFLYVQMGPL